MADEEKPKLNPKQEFFCQLYASDRDFFANGVQSYAEAYDIDIRTKSGYATAKVNSSKLLTNANILARINEILELHGLNDVFVDKQLEFLITQNADLSTKVRAINEYNKLKSRITEKIDHTSAGKPIPILGNLNAISTDNSNQENSEAEEAHQGDTGRDISQQDDLDRADTDRSIAE
jgi:phage terminase small subunit